MTEDVEPVYEPAPTVTALTGNESAPNAATLAAVCWLLRRYSSHAYIARAHVLLRAVVEAFDAWPHADERCSPAIAKKWRKALHDHRSDFERGLKALERGRTAEAYAAIAEAAAGLEPDDPRNDLHLSVSHLLDELGPATAVGGTRACAMALRIEHTLKATWAFERILADRPSLHMRPLRLPDRLPAVTLRDRGAPEVNTDRTVPQTGIWIPTTFRGGCPNFLVEGFRAPPAVRACERIDYPEIPAEGPYEARPAWSDYEFIAEPATWRLVWADERYRGGAVDDESGFLDEENALPS